MTAGPTIVSGAPVERAVVEIEASSSLPLSPAAPFVLERAGHDHRNRWRVGERLESMFEARCAELAGTAAVEVDGVAVSYAALDASANRLARQLVARGVAPGDRIAILLPNGLDSYVAMLAAMKVRAAFVPLDASFPDDRIAFILDDAAAVAVVTTTGQLGRFAADATTLVAIDGEADEIASRSAEALSASERGRASDELCYIIYTSGTTGRPKGVQIDHAQICNFVAVAVETYGLRPGARMYQGLTIAFDFSVEEIWVPLLVGATLIPAPPGGKLVGEDLHRFLSERRVTAMCVVPTLLATLDGELPDLDFLLVSGEACPQDLVSRWSRPGRTFLNAYGPTETTVTATLGELRPGRPVTIGSPLPTYRIVILDPDRPIALERGATGEIAIAGPGLSRGYLNRDDLTSRAFVVDFLGLPDNPTGRLYRTGDLGRIVESGEIEYAGRIDTQVKIRGYRIELTEIETVILAVPGVAQAVVEPWRPTPEQAELVAYYTVAADADVTPDAIHAALREQLPGYMVPAFLERLDRIPLLPSDKADRKRLPPPSGPRFAAVSVVYEPAREGVESEVAAIVAAALGTERVSVTAHLFDELGANSLLIARVAARLRGLYPNVPLAMKDVYLAPTVRGIAEIVERGSARASVRPASPPLLRASRSAYLATAAAQAAAYFAVLWLYGYSFVSVMDWVDAATSQSALVARAVVASVLVSAVWCGLPILAKWTLVGRFRPERFAVWSVAYFRFWLVRALIRTSPLALFTGTPLCVAYLRLLGARIGRNVLLLPDHMPIATDLIEIGDDTIVRKDVAFRGYRAEAGGIELGPVRIGRGCTIGEGSILDIDTVMEDGASLAHASALLRGQRIPAGETWHGSPAVRRAAAAPAPARLPAPGRAARIAYAAFVGGVPLLVTLPASILLLVWLHRLVPGDNFDPFGAVDNVLLTSLVAYLGMVVLGALVVAGLPRLAWAFFEEGREYPLYGFHYDLLRVIRRWSNSKFYNILFGDSSYILYYLRWIGWRISPRGQTGSNFGLVQRHDVPFTTEFGDGTLVSDGLIVSNVEYTPASFRVVRAGIGARSFLGNAVVVPPGGLAGDDCLLATKLMIPTDGPLRSGVGLLGSPPFEIPRSVRRDEAFDALKAPGVIEERIRRKNRHNLATIGLFLTSRWLLFLATLAIAERSFDQHGMLGALEIAASGLLMTLVAVTAYVAIERLTLGFGRLSPRTCSIYEPYYWFHERYWKMNDATFINLFNGTPFKNLVWRLLGVRWGHMNFDDGCAITERTLVEVGDHNTFGELATLQSHSLEGGVFKSDLVRVGNGCSFGSKAYVSYGTVTGDGAVVEPDSFVMKGETLPAASFWRGNPARLVP